MSPPERQALTTPELCSDLLQFQIIDFRTWNLRKILLLSNSNMSKPGSEPQLGSLLPSNSTAAVPAAGSGVPPPRDDQAAHQIQAASCGLSPPSNSQAAHQRQATSCGLFPPSNSQAAHQIQAASSGIPPPSNSQAAHQVQAASSRVPLPSNNQATMSGVPSGDQATMAGTPRNSQNLRDQSEAPQARGAKWDSWEDRALARQVLADDPLNCVRGRTPEKWQDVSKHLTELKPKAMQRSADSCRSCLKKLVLWHKSEQSASLQKTGTDEEVDQFVQDMDEIVIQWDQNSVDSEVREEAVEKAKKLEADGLKIRDDSLRGLVRKRDEEIERAKEEGTTPPPTEKKAKKNQVARRVEEIIGDVQQANKKDEVIIKELQNIENQHHTAVTEGLKAIATELKEDRVVRQQELEKDREIRKQEWMDMMRVFARGFEGFNH